MFTVAPSGNTKLEILFETPAFSCKHFRVTGKVAEEEAVEKDVNKASFIANKCFNGLTLPTR